MYIYIYVPTNTLFWGSPGSRSMLKKIQFQKAQRPRLLLSFAQRLKQNWAASYSLALVILMMSLHFCSLLLKEVFSLSLQHEELVPPLSFLSSPSETKDAAISWREIAV
jgi:hypothetical protein